MARDSSQIGAVLVPLPATASDAGNGKLFAEHRLRLRRAESLRVAIALLNRAVDSSMKNTAFPAFAAGICPVRPAVVRRD